LTTDYSKSLALQLARHNADFLDEAKNIGSERNAARGLFLRNLREKRFYPLQWRLIFEPETSAAKQGMALPP